MSEEIFDQEKLEKAMQAACDEQVETLKRASLVDWEPDSDYEERKSYKPQGVEIYPEKIKEILDKLKERNET